MPVERQKNDKNLEICNSFLDLLSISPQCISTHRKKNPFKTYWQTYNFLNSAGLEIMWVNLQLQCLFDKYISMNLNAKTLVESNPDRCTVIKDERLCVALFAVHEEKCCWIEVSFSAKKSPSFSIFCSFNVQLLYATLDKGLTHGGGDGSTS